MNCSKPPAGLRAALEQFAEIAEDSGAEMA